MVFDLGIFDPDRKLYRYDEPRPPFGTPVTISKPITPPPPRPEPARTPPPPRDERVFINGVEYVVFPIKDDESFSHHPGPEEKESLPRYPERLSLDDAQVVALEDAITAELELLAVTYSKVLSGSSRWRVLNEYRDRLNDLREDHSLDAQAVFGTIRRVINRWGIEVE